MESYTYMSNAGISATTANLPEHYEMSLSRNDMSRLMLALAVAYDNGAHVSDDCNSSVCLVCWAGQFVSTIAETVGVEFV